MEQICADLRAEHAALDAVVSGIDDEAWDIATPAEGWSVRDQISHLMFFDGTALLAATDADAFEVSKAAVLRAGVDVSVEPGRGMTPATLLASWREGRATMLAAFEALDPKARIPWYGPAMGAISFATARLMETWAHGQDVVDAVHGSRPPSDRLRHVAHIGVGARRFSYMVNGREMPDVPIRVELQGPSGDRWTWGPDDASDVVRGDALDFCLLVTQRRHRRDVVLEVIGDAADDWLSIAQAFAGPPGGGRSAAR